MFSHANYVPRQQAFLILQTENFCGKMSGKMSAVKTSALIKAFDLISLFRKFYLSEYNWNAVTREYKAIIDKVENR